MGEKRILDGDILEKTFDFFLRKLKKRPDLLSLMTSFH